MSHKTSPIGASPAASANLALPKVIFGTSALGNLFQAIDYADKLKIVEACCTHAERPVVFDSAGKYGAGLALETLGRCLKELNVAQEEVVISNKLGWLRTELKTPEPTFEPGVWKGLQYDAVQKISYDGMMECFEQGNALLNGYIPQMVSVHDPDEYLSGAQDERHAAQRYQDILDAYRALKDLKQQGKVQSVGVGAKDWRVVQRIAHDINLDWVMIANSMTLLKHPEELQHLLRQLEAEGVTIINSAVFHSGFLIGTDYFDYRLIRPDTPANQALFQWREKFFEICRDFAVRPAEAAVQFALNVPGVKSIALNTSDAGRVQQNLAMASLHIPMAFWQTMKREGLMDARFFMEQPLKN